MTILHYKISILYDHGNGFDCPAEKKEKNFKLIKVDLKSLTIL